MKRSRYPFLTAVTAIFSALLTFQPCFGQSAVFIDALKARQEGDHAAAIKLFEEEIELSGGNPAACFFLAEVLLDEGRNITQADVDRAETLLRRALEGDPGNYWYKYALANLFARTDRIELSAALFEELIAAHPTKSDLYFDAARAYISVSDYDKAFESIDKIEAKAGKNDMICIAKMEFLSRKNNGDERAAYEYLEEYCRDYSSPRLNTMLGDWYRQNFRDSLAIESYTKAIELDASYTPAYYGRAHAYQDLRQYIPYFQDMNRFMGDEHIDPALKVEYIENMFIAPQLLRTFEPEVNGMVFTLLAAHPGDTIVQSAAGLHFYRTGNQPAGLSIMRKNAEENPESFTLGFQYLLMLYFADEYDDAIAQATLLGERFPEDTDARLVRASVHSRLKEYQKAIADYEEVAARRPKDSVSIMATQPALGDLYYRTGNYKKAFKCFEKALRAAPDNSMVLNNYAYFLSLEGKKLKKAKEMSGKAIAAEPDNPTYIDTYAWILHLMGQDREAKAMFKNAMIHGGKEHAEILDHYAEVLYALKEYDLAYIYWNQAKSLDDSLGIDEKIKARKEGEKR